MPEMMSNPELNKDQLQKDLEGLVETEKSTLMTEEQKKEMADKADKAKIEKDKADVKQAEDQVLLDKKEEERTSEEAERAKTVLEERKQAEEKKKAEEKADEDSKLSVDDKIKRIKEKSEKRISDISAEIKELKDQGSKEAEILRSERDNLLEENKKLRGSEQSQDIRSKVKDMENERTAKYLSEDGDKNREDRREMTKEEIDDWYLEDAVAATEWIQERLLRRSKERSVDFQKVTAKDVVGKQKESLSRIKIRHPELDAKSMAERLKAEGKSDAEIRDAVLNNPKAVLLTKIVKEHPEYLSMEDGPERSVTEMERRMNLKPETNKKDERIADLEAKIDDLDARLTAKQTGDEGINSSRMGKKDNADVLIGSEQNLVNIMKGEGASQDKIDAALVNYRNKGA